MSGKSVNPLKRTHPVVHLPLAVLAIAFSLPFCWLLASSLQPREQAMSHPPEWVPEVHRIDVDGEAIWVTPPEEVGQESVLVRFRTGPFAGETRLIPAEDFADGVATVTVQRADYPEELGFEAEVLREVAASDVAVREWQLRKIPGETTTPRRFFVPADAVDAVVRPLWENYPEAIRALTADQKDKNLPMGALMAKSHLPWHDRGEGTITFLTYLGNTLMIAVLGVIGTVLSSSLAAYGLARIRWKGRGLLFAITLATMMVPFPVIMIPLYGVFRELGWIGTTLPLWVPAFFGGAFNIFLLRQFFLTIPDELSDAARIDGASELRIWWDIVMPLAKPALAVVALFHFLYAWNDFLGPLIFLTRPETFTLALGLQQYQSQSGGSEWHLLMAASVLLVLPIIVLFFFAQRTFIQGIATTGGKG